MGGWRLEVGGGKLGGLRVNEGMFLSQLTGWE